MRFKNLLIGVRSKPNGITLPFNVILQYYTKTNNVPKFIVS